MKKLVLKLVLVFAVLMLLTASIGMAYPHQQGGDRHSGGHGGYQQHWNHHNYQPSYQSYWSWGWPSWSWNYWGYWGRWWW